MKKLSCNKTSNKLKKDDIIYLQKQAPVLEDIKIEVSYACNMNCETCNRRNDPRPDFMEIPLFKKIISDLERIEFGGIIWLHYSGEPLIHPEFNQIAEIIYKAGLSPKVALITNGLLLNEKKLNILKENLILNLNISLHGTKEYMSNYCSPNSYERILDNIKLINYKYPHIFEITIHIALYKQQENVLEELIDELSPYADKFEIFPTVNQSTMELNKHSWHTFQDYDVSKKTCTVPWESITVLTDGRVNVCCFDLGAKKIVKGLDMNYQTIEEVFQSSEYKTLRSRFCRRYFKDNFYSCGNCSAWKMVDYFKTLTCKKSF